MTEDKFQKVYRQYYQFVKKVVYSVLRDIDLSEDICQEVFIIFTEKAVSLPERYYEQWFLINARRKAIDFCRKSYQIHEVAVSHSDEMEIPQDRQAVWTSCKHYGKNGIEDEITHRLALREFTGELFEDLEKKNSDWYEIVMRMHVEGQDAKETARALGISLENLRTKRHRIKVWINKYYRKKYEDI